MPVPRTVLMVHNRYLERGGEDVVYEAECRLLEDAGFRVFRYERDNREVAAMSRPGLAAGTLWNGDAARAVEGLVRRERVDVVHFHNTFPLISPAAHHGARRAGAAVVQTLHNFRLLCAAGVFMRDGRPCESCLGRAVPWPAVVHRCYRNGAAVSAVVAASITAHRALRTWQTKVDAFIALSGFARDRFIAGGLPADRIHVHGGLAAAAMSGPATVEPPVMRSPGPDEPMEFLFVGRLSPEKGIETLLDAWHLVRDPFRLRIIGNGPLRGRVQAAAAADQRITWLGARTAQEVMAAMATADALVFPTRCYENYPAVLAEAQAAGLPVVASRLGSAAEIVDDVGFGLLFDAGNARDLADGLKRMATDPDARAMFAGRALAGWRDNLSPDRYLERLDGIYQSALARTRPASAEHDAGAAADGLRA